MTRKKSEDLDLVDTLKAIGLQVIVIDAGNDVLCDLCNKSYIDDDTKGGFLFSSKAVCPDCAPKFEESAKSFKEEKYITWRCAPDETFRDFVYRIREGQKS